MVTGVAFVGVGAVAAQESGANASISEQTSGGHTVVVDEVAVPEGGFVTVHDATVLDGGEAVSTSVRGTSTYLEAGTHEDVEVSIDRPLAEDGTVVAMPHLDTNGNQQYDFLSEEGGADGPYTEGGNAVVADAALTVETDDGSADGDGETRGPVDGSRGDGTGFGALVALLAILGSVFAARRGD